jgi:hypothetical protein
MFDPPGLVPQYGDTFRVALISLLRRSSELESDVTQGKSTEGVNIWIKAKGKQTQEH